MKKMLLSLFISSSILLLTNQNTLALNLANIDTPIQVKLDKLNEFTFIREGDSVIADKRLHVSYSLQALGFLGGRLKSTTFLITLSHGEPGTLIASVKNVLDTSTQYFKIIFLKVDDGDCREWVIWHILNDIACSLLIEYIIYHQKNTHCVLCKKEFDYTCINDFQSRSFHDFCYLICGHWMHYSCFEKLEGYPVRKCPYCGVSIPSPEYEYMIKTWSERSVGIPTTSIKIF